MSRRGRLLAAAAVVAALAATAACLTGWRPGGPHGHYRLTHPESALVAAEAKAAAATREVANPVEWAWEGGLEATAVRVRARLSRPSERVRLWVGEDPGLAEARPIGPVPASADRERIAALEIEGLEPDRRYFWELEVDGERDPATRGSFRTAPRGAASFTLALGSCAATGSTGAVFDAVARHEPLFLLHMGDLHYENLDDDRLDLFLRAYGWVLASPPQRRLYRQVPLEYVFDDHDFGGNNSDPTVPSRRAAQRAFRLAVPHRPLPAQDAASAEEGPIYRAFTVGRVRFVIADLRSQRSPRRDPDGPAKTMLGAAQKAWLEAELRAAKTRQALTVWVSTTPWIAEPDPDADHWGGYDHERREIAAFLEAEAIDRLVMLSGDAHMLAIDDGRHNRYGPSGKPLFPVFQAAAFDRSGSRKGGPYSSGTFPGGGHFGLMTVEDAGSTVTVRWSGRDWSDRELVGLERVFAVPPLGAEAEQP